MMDRVKVLVTDREFFISEDDVSEPLFELEMVLLESDVALPVTEEIISLVRQNLTGQRRKIGESVDGIVFSALRDALMQVLGDGFDLPAYIRGHDRPVKILFTGVNGTGKTTTVAKIASFLKKRIFSCHRRRRHLQGRGHRADRRACPPARDQDHPAPAWGRSIGGSL